MTGVIENLYRVFAKYPINTTISGCPCCVSDVQKQVLHTKSLRDLSTEDLEQYTFKAMTTWGDVKDFKHYLPRILELFTTHEFCVDIAVIFGKLQYAHWQAWPHDEHEAITAFLYAWWGKSVCYETCFDKELFLEIYKATQQIEPLLECWKLSFQDNSFSNFVDFICDCYYRLITPTKEFSCVGSKALHIWLSWIEQHAKRLEEGFFYTGHDDTLLEKISTASYILEQSKTIQKIF